MTRGIAPGNLPAVKRIGRLESSTQLITLLVAAALALTVAFAGAAVPFTRATVTRTLNKVAYGQIAGGKGRTQPAKTGDIVGPSNYLLTESESRAELQYDDGSVVRIGQNTVFSFEADSRTLTLKEGTFTFFVPRGGGAGMIKTPSFTAAITGTVGKVSRDTISVLEGEITLIPSGKKVGAGEFARRQADGQMAVARFDPTTAGDGSLMAFNGPMPGFSEDRLAPGRRLALAMPNTSQLEAVERTQNLPGAIDLFNLPRTRITIPRPPNDHAGAPPY